VLLPGMDGTGNLFYPLLNELPLSIKTQVITYSKNCSQSYSELLEEIKQQLPNSPFVLLAESFSGLLAHAISLERSIPVEKIILVATFLSSPKPILSIFHRYLPLGILFSFPIPNFIFQAFCFNQKADKKLLDTLRKTVKQVDNQVLAHRLRLIAECISPNQLSEIPALIIMPTRDRLVSKSALVVVETKFRESTLRQIQGPHFIAQICPKQVSKLILDFTNTP
jgi:pimeloyl-[acyl-carrier protein] methyl ester esterase